MIGAVLRVRYELTRQLGDSPFFLHYAAYDKVQSRDVSVRLLKEPFRRDEDLLTNLEDVVKRASAVHHPGIEDLYEIDSDENAVFVVGQLTPGASVGERLRKLTTFSVPATIEVGIAICEALQALHRAGIADGDLSTSTVAMQADGEVRLQCAGLWQALLPNQAAREAFLGETAAYSAPEISKGGLPTPATDIYSLGVMLYELLTGRKPYNGDGAVMLALQHATEPVPGVRQSVPSIPQPLDHIISKAMAKTPAQRYADGGEMLSDLRMLQDALRFGKSLTWPMRTDSAKAEPVAVALVAAPAQEPGPQKREQKEKPQKAPKPKDDADIPGWLRGIFIICAWILFALIAIFGYQGWTHPASLKVPELKNLSVTDARRQLVRMGLSLTVAKTQASDGPADIVLSTDPGPGEAVLKGADVRATISQGSNYVEVPDLRGFTPDKARATLHSIGLELDDRMDRLPDKDIKEGLIVSQAQAPRGKYQRGTKIIVQVSSGRGRSTSDDPNADRKYVYSMTLKLTKLDRPVRLQIDMTDARGTKTVMDAQHNPDETVPIKAEGYGSQVTFRIFYDGELVKQMDVPANGSENFGRLRRFGR